MKPQLVAVQNDPVLQLRIGTQHFAGRLVGMEIVGAEEDHLQGFADLQLSLQEFMGDVAGDKGHVEGLCELPPAGVLDAAIDDHDGGLRGVATQHPQIAGAELARAHHDYVVLQAAQLPALRRHHPQHSLDYR